ncbi:50S ribosomal protein L17 [Candidatus Nomurabacteria bacterium]|nr:50S ribosomal protein L17 [Candidatus Kaiserbacteria bacterium]MCB9813955.1 50S ribosomal protein L17 [Candidatus Nomurabacteria bacterium]
MRHSNNTRTLSRSRSQRTALISGLAVSLIRDGQIKTTLAKAKELQPNIERLITHAKTNTVQARRLVASRLGEPKDEIIQKLFTIIAPTFSERNGGYTRVIKLGNTSPGREEAIIAFVE